jgi:small neutral amino acid transporter SnatA (MarC family)
MIIKPMEHGKIGNESAEGFLIVFIVSLVKWFIAYSISISGSVIYRLYGNIPMMILFIVIGFIVMMVNMPIIFKERNVFIKKFLYLFKQKQQQAKTSKVS